MAIGLQKVDNLKPSKYFEKSKKEDINKGEFECDLVSTRIVELLKKISLIYQLII